MKQGRWTKIIAGSYLRKDGAVKLTKTGPHHWQALEVATDRVLGIHWTLASAKVNNA